MLLPSSSLNHVTPPRTRLLPAAQPGTLLHGAAPGAAPGAPFRLGPVGALLGSKRVLGPLGVHHGTPVGDLLMLFNWRILFPWEREEFADMCLGQNGGMLLRRGSSSQSPGGNKSSLLSTLLTWPPTIQQHHCDCDYDY